MPDRLVKILLVEDSEDDFVLIDLLSQRHAYHQRILTIAATTQSHKRILMFLADARLCVKNGTNMKLRVMLYMVIRMATLPDLSVDGYDHKYYVDGSPTVGDAF